MPEMELLQQAVLSLVVLCMITVIGLSVAQSGLDMVGFEATDEFCSTKDNIVTMIDDSFNWMPVLLIAMMGGLAIFAVGRYIGFIG